MKRADHGKLEGGYVYVMSNPSTQGFFKIGHTVDLERRRLDLSRETSIPLPFKCEFAIFSTNHPEIEKRAHAKLDHYRIPGKEFFTCDLATIIRHVQEAYTELSEVQADSNPTLIVKQVSNTTAPATVPHKPAALPEESETGKSKMHVTASEEESNIKKELSDPVAPSKQLVDRKDFYHRLLVIMKETKSDKLLRVHHYFKTHSSFTRLGARAVAGPKMLSRYLTEAAAFGIEINFANESGKTKGSR